MDYRARRLRTTYCWHRPPRSSADRREESSKPPKDFPEFDQTKPDDTDFQLQQGLAVANAMALAQNGVTAN